MDSNTLMVGDSSYLWWFDINAGYLASAKDIRAGSWVDSFNMGVFVIKPDILEYNFLLEKLSSFSVTYELAMAEQGFLNALYVPNRKWVELDFIFNANLAVFEFKTDHWSQQFSNIRIIHFTMQKPWNCQGLYQPVCALWSSA